MRLYCEIIGGGLVLYDLARPTNVSDSPQAQMKNQRIGVFSPAYLKRSAIVTRLSELMRDGWNGSLRFSSRFGHPSLHGWPDDHAREFVRQVILEAGQIEALRKANLVLEACPVPVPERPEPKRPETGSYQFGDDWPGVFIRGDEAAAAASALETLLRLVPAGVNSHFPKLVIDDLANALSGSRALPDQNVTVLRPLLECMRSQQKFAVNGVADANGTVKVKSIDLVKTGKPFPLPDGSIVFTPKKEEEEPDAHGELIEAVGRFIEAIYPDFAGYLPAAMNAMADAAKKCDWSYHQSRMYKDILEVLMTLSR